MKISDIAGFAVILTAGYIVGRDVERGAVPFHDKTLVALLLVVGFYLAVTLS